MRALDSDGEMSDLSNGVKYGQSNIYDSEQYNHDIAIFRKMALGEDSSEVSEDYSSREMTMPYSNKSGNNSTELSSAESETRAMNDSGEHKYGGHQAHYGGQL